MKKLFGLIFFIVLIVGAAWFFLKDKKTTNEQKPEALKASLHSNEFNKSIYAVISGYLLLKDAFVESDTVAIKIEQQKFANLLDSLNLNDLKKDTTGIYESAQAQRDDMKANTIALAKETNLTEMRQDFRMISESLYPFLKTIHYKGNTLFWQSCPMAFGDDTEGSWISNSDEILNPYLGKNHPQYKSGMLHCGELKDSIK
jgi:hypothetical protein